MRYKTFKNIKISEIGLGCWAFGGTWNNTDDQRSIDTIKEAIRRGINFIDTAPVYGFGHSEKIVGEALKGFNRDEYVLASKCGLVWDEKNNITNNLSKDSILREIDLSLERLQVEYIDIYQLHWPDPNTDLEETIEALKILLDEGKIKAVGISNFNLEDFKRLDRELNVVTYQGLYNMFEHNPDSYHEIPLEYRAKDEIFPYCLEKNIAYLPYSPLMQGLLAGAFKEENNFDENDSRSANPKLRGEEFKRYYSASLELQEIADEIEKPFAQLSLNWLCDHPEIGPVICGAQTIEQIEENIETCTWELSEETRQKIAGVLKKYNIG